MSPKHKHKTRAEIEAEIDFVIERQTHRLDQELIKLKLSGVMPKNSRLFISDVMNVAKIIGVKRLAELTYQQFLCYVEKIRSGDITSIK